MSNFKKFAVFMTASLFIAGIASQSYAERVYAKDNDTKVSTERTEKKKSFRERIDAILAEIDKADGKDAKVDKSTEVLEDTPVITSVYDERIMGTPMAKQEQCVRYLLRNNPYPKISVSPEELVAIYYEEAQKEGVRPDVAFSQALHETGFFRYGGTVTPDQNNYCGLGTTSATTKGHYFESARLGVRAHIQHILAYAAQRFPREEIIDPRYHVAKNAYGHLGIDTWNGFNGRWAVPGTGYGNKILWHFRNIMAE